MGRVGMVALRERSLRLTGYLETLLDDVTVGRAVEVVTPRNPEARGCQLSLHVPAGAKQLAGQLRDEEGIVCDEREPNVIRFAPTPLYSRFHDAWPDARALERLIPCS